MTVSPPVTWRMNAMRVPSGENAGAVSMSSTSLRGGTLPRSGIRNNDTIGSFEGLNTYSTDSPSGENARPWYEPAIGGTICTRLDVDT